MKGCKGADAVAEVTKARREDMDFELESIRHAAFQRGWSPQEVRMVFSAGMAACSVIRPEMVQCRKIDAAVTVPPSAVVLVYLQEGTGADVCGLSLAEKVGLTAVEEGWDASLTLRVARL